MEEQIQKLLVDKREFQDKIRGIDHKLTDIVINFKGSVATALKIGLVRLNFPAPPGLVKHTLHDRK